MSLSNKIYWIWLSQALGYCNRKIKALFELYKDISEFYEGGEKEWKFCGILSPNDISRLHKTKLDTAEKIITQCDELGYKTIAIDEEHYPQCLLHIYNPPAVLYICGTLPDVDRILTIGIVGTRTASNYGLQNSYKIGYSLSKYGVVTVSGGALGIDCASHRGALAANGVTVCVLGCGINYPYLQENASMRQLITMRGALISEYPPDTPAKPYHFPARNRLIAALSAGVLIIESGKNSGSLITADFALDMGKELFALLGNNSPNNEGSNERIKEGTATPITDFMDIISAFHERLEEEPKPVDYISLEEVEDIPVKGKKRTRKHLKGFKKMDTGYTIEDVLDTEHPTDRVEKKPVHKDNPGVSGDAETVYRYLTAEPVHIDKISQDLGLPVYRVLSALTQLEISDLATACRGRRFVLK